MSIKMACPNPRCKRSLTAKQEMAGRRLKCPACGGGIGVPNGRRQPSRDDELDELDEVPRRRGRSARDDDDYDDDYDRPRRGQGQGRGAPPSKGIDGLGVILLFAGLGMLALLMVAFFL